MKGEGLLEKLLLGEGDLERAGDGLLDGLFERFLVGDGLLEKCLPGDELMEGCLESDGDLECDLVYEVYILQVAPHRRGTGIN